MDFKRARSLEQIELREQDIANAAAVLFDAGGYENVNYTDIAKAAGITRPTIYKYFATKDEILLRLLASEVIEWASWLEERLPELLKCSMHDVAVIFTKSIATRSRLFRLYSIVYTVLEKNSSVTRLTEYKRTIILQQQRMYRLLRTLFPRSSAHECYVLLNSLLSFAIGLYPMCNVSDVQRKAVISTNENFVIPDFSAVYCESAEKWLNAVQTGAANES